MLVRAIALRRLRPRHFDPRWWLVAALVSSPACGSDGLVPPWLAEEQEGSEGGEVDPTPGGEDGAASPGLATAFAEAYCAAWERCTCTVAQFEDRKACESDLTRLFSDTRNAVADATVDLECYQAIVAMLEGDDCESIPEIAARGGLAGCLLFRGTHTEGQPCYASRTATLPGDSCAEGLSCWFVELDRVCIDPTPPDPVPGIGEACTAGPVECDDGSYCDQDTWTCIERVALGAACEFFECPRGAWCVDEICVAPPEIGGPCVDDRCPTARLDRAVVVAECVDGQCEDFPPMVCFTGFP